MSLKIVKLRNGSEEAETFVNAVYSTLSFLFTLPEDGNMKNVFLFIDLVSLCRGSVPQVSPGSRDEIIKLSLLLPNGAIHDSVKNVVLSSIEGEGLDMRLVDPVAL